MCFSKNGKRIIIADKFGDVYASATENPDGKNRLITGHVSMILDTILSQDGKFLLTADRDEKIRVSRFPNCFQVENFCLGHTQFVSSICNPSFSPSTLISGGADTFICLWDFEKGVELDRFDLTPYITKVSPVAERLHQIPHDLISLFLHLLEGCIGHSCCPYCRLL